VWILWFLETKTKWAMARPPLATVFAFFIVPAIVSTASLSSQKYLKARSAAKVGIPPDEDVICMRCDNLGRGSPDWVSAMPSDLFIR
jgi:hypothetical protein